MECEVHEGCREPAVAKVGLPSSRAQWVCEEGFNEFQGNPRCDATVGDRSDAGKVSLGLRCKLRAGHEGWHESGTTRWT